MPKGIYVHKKEKPMSEEGRQHIREAKKGNTNGKGRKGKHYSKLSEAQKGKTGEKCNSWKGGVTPLNHLIRTSAKSEEWRKVVFERDHYTCQLCGDNKGGNLNAHHIEGFANYPEKRFDVDNGITLCKSCHKLIHKSVFMWIGENMIHGGAS